MNKALKVKLIKQMVLYEIGGYEIDYFDTGKTYSKPDVFIEICNTLQDSIVRKALTTFTDVVLADEDIQKVEVFNYIWKELDKCPKEMFENTQTLEFENTRTADYR
jgi:hypothetical protein